MKNPAGDYPQWRRWTIYLIGVLENVIFGGVIYGWAQLTYLLKMEGVYYDYCEDNLNISANQTVNSTENEELHKLYYKGCDEQDTIFALIFTIACFFNTLPAGPFGYLIHRFGLALNRLLATFLNVTGFVAVGLTTHENPGWLFAAMILLALGNMLLRITSLQFVNLIQKNRSTAMSVISGAYTTSAGIFLGVQLAVEAGWNRSHVCWILAGLAFLSAPATLIMPFHNIIDGSTLHGENPPKTPLSTSLFSLSGFLQLYWISVCYGTASLYGAKFNSWISDISQNDDEASRYSSLFSMFQLLCPLASFLPGVLTDFISMKPTKIGENKDYRTRKIKNLQSCIPSIFLVTFLQMFLQICTLFKTSEVVYLSIIMLAILRASISPVTSDFIRLRFPPDHFIRLTGLAEAGIVIMLSLQYPFFLWAQTHYLAATLAFMALQLVSLLHPLHLLSTKYLLKISKQDFTHSSHGSQETP